MADEEVPGMAERVERRRRELGLTPTGFARAAGLSLQGLAPLRKGYRRAYHDKLKLGVARALHWEDDAVDRLLDGEEPVPRSRADYTKLGNLDVTAEAVRRARESLGGKVEEFAAQAMVPIEAWEAVERAEPVELTNAQLARMSSVLQWDGSQLVALLGFGDAAATREIEPYVIEARLEELEEQMQWVVAELRRQRTRPHLAVAAEGADDATTQNVGRRVNRPAPEPEPDGP